MRITIKNKVKREPDLYVAATDALLAHKDDADFRCDGTADDVQIQSALTELVDVGGVVQLSEGNFSTTGLIQFGDDFLTLKGAGDGATRITQATANTACINTYNHDGCEISDLRVVMPSTNAGDGIQAGTGITMNNVGIQGGDTTAYLMRLTDSFNFNLNNIKGHGGIGNGIMFDYTGELYYGNGSLRNVQFSMKSNSIGIYVGARYNLSLFDTINMVTGQGTGNGIYGFYINGAFNNTFNMLDLEGLDYSVHATNSAKGNHFMRVYSTARLLDIFMDTGTKNNLFISTQTGSNPWKIQNDGLRDLSGRNRFINLAAAGFGYESEPPRFYDDFDGVALSHVWDTEGTVALTNGLATITTPNTTGENALIDFGGNSGYKDAYETYMEFKAKRVSNGSYDAYYGLRNTGWESTHNSAYFRALNTDTNWQAVVTKGDAINTTDTGVAIDAVAHTFKMHKYSVGTATQFFIDDVLVASMHNSPTTTSLREPCFEVVTQEDGAKSIAVDYVILQQGRALTP